MDEWLLHLINQTWAHPVLDVIMAFGSWVGLALCPAVGAALLSGPARRRPVGLALLTALVAGLALTLAFQYMVGRPRPDDVRLVSEPPNYPSFPSGHAMAGFATAVVIGLSIRRSRAWAALLVAAALLALSRVYLGHHYPTDVLAGAVLGAGVGAASYGLIVERAPGVARWRWLLWPQVALIIVVSQVAYLGRLPLEILRLPYTDKLLHFLMFGSVVFWLNLWLGPRRVGPVPLAVGLPFGLAVLEEGAQSFSSWRSSGLDDLAADLAGMLLFWWLSQRMLRRAKPARLTRSLEAP